MPLALDWSPKQRITDRSKLETEVNLHLAKDGVSLPPNFPLPPPPKK